MYPYGLAMIHFIRNSQTIRERLDSCLTKCRKQSDSVTSWRRMLFGDGYEDCVRACHKNERSLGVWRCNRNLDSTGADFRWRMIFSLADAMENHSFLSCNACPTSRENAYTLEGERNKQGGKPSNESTLYSKSAECARCYAKDRPLLYGSGAGKSGYDATAEERADCVRNARVRKDYSPYGYNCNSWTLETAINCGMACEDRSLFGTELDNSIGINQERINVDDINR